MRDYAMESTMRNVRRHIETAKDIGLKTIYYGFIPFVIAIGLNSARVAASEMGN